jgi:hypothetical protein
VSFSALAASSQSSINSSAFGTFSAGKIYVVDVLLDSTMSDNSTPTIKLAVAATGGTPTLTFAYEPAQTTTDRGNASTGETDTYAKVVVNGTSSATNFQLILTLTALDSTSGTPLSTTGTYISQLVGSLM